MVKIKPINGSERKRAIPHQVDFPEAKKKDAVH